MTTIPENIFSLLIALTDLNLSDDLSQRALTLEANAFATLGTLDNLDLSGNNLRNGLNTLSFSGLGALQTLDLSGNNLSPSSLLDNAIFSPLSGLRELNLFSNVLNNIPANVFSSLNALTELNLSGNRISLNNATQEAFVGLSSLTTLNLSNNILTTIPDNVFSPLIELTTLNLSGNSISIFPDETFSPLTNLTILDISSTISLIELSPTAFSTLSNLQTLLLNVTQLSTLPEGIFNGLRSLSGLNFTRDGNPALRLRMTPRLVSGTSFEGGGMSRIALEVVQGAPTDLTATVTIEGGTLSDTTTTTVDLTIVKGTIRSAPVVVIPGSTAEEVTLTVDAIPTLTPYDSNTMIGYSGLTVAAGSAFTGPVMSCDRSPQVLAEILEQIATISGAPLASCADIRDSHLMMITALDLSSRGIFSLQDNDFVGLGNLETLNLDNNAVSSLPSNVFSDLSALRVLNLDRNRLTSLEAGVFSDLSSLVSLTLAGNRQQYSPLPPGIFVGLVSLESLRLSRSQGIFFLDLTPKEYQDTQNSFVVEVVEGAPAELTATVTIDGGTFSGGATTIDAIISTGTAQSDPIPFTLNPGRITATITVTQTAPADLEVTYDDSTDPPTGYDAIRLQAGSPLTVGSGICNRTQGVQDGIINALRALNVEGIRDCRNVSNASLNRITNLDSSGQSITSLTPDDFAGLGMLTSLNLSNNMLESLPNRVFSSLSMLTSLDVSDNALTDLPDGLFEGLTALTEADFSDNPGADFTLTLTLQTTDVQNQFVVEVAQGVPINIVAIVRITGGTFSDNEMSANTVVQKGRTQSNPITVTPPAPGTSPMLMVTTPNSLGSSYSGLAIEASSRSFQLGICDRTQEVQDAILLAIPDVSDCAQVILSELEGITGTLNLENQSIASLMAHDFEGLTALTTLDLGDNQLTELPDGIFTDLTSLTTLNLFSNQLTASMVPSGIFNALSALESLDLGDNDLMTLDANLFAGLTALTELDLSDNGLTMLDEDIFDGLTELITLNLSSNALSALPAGLFSGLEMLTGVQVDGQVVNGTMIASLPLTVTLQETGPGMAAIEVAQGVPFTSVTATLSITGGTFPGETDPRERTVTLSTGEIRSSPFTFTVDQSTVATPVPEAMIRITDTSSDPSEILDGTQGYSGFTLVASDTPLTRQMNICTRTDQVQTEILEQINNATPNLAVTCTTVTSALLAAIDELDLSGQSIATLMPDDFVGLGMLTSLDLSDNMLENLPEGVFSDLMALESLDLSGNDLTMLPEGVFSDLMTLEILDLSGNDLTMLPEGVFSDLTMLTGVDASSNPNPGDILVLTVTPKVISDGMAMIEVVQGVPFGLTATVEITGGDFSGNPSTTVTLSKGETQSAAFQYTVTDLTTVITVSITSPMNSAIAGSFNDITGVGYSGFALFAGEPLVIGDGICRRTMAVQTVLLRLLGPDATCQTVTNADLARIGDDDPVTGINSPLLLVNIPSLQSEDFAGLTNLKTLILFQSRSLTTLPANIFTDLANLQTLNLYSNGLTALDPTLFTPLTSLTSLNLFDNALTTLDAAIFDGLIALETLNLQSNALTMLPSDIFDGLQNLQHLNVSGNRLTELPDGIFSGLTALIGVDVSGQEDSSGNAIGLLPLTVTPKMVSNDMAVIEVVAGVPFDGVTATLEITEGNFSGDSTTTATIAKGETQSAAFAYTMNPMAEITTITVTEISNPMDGEIDDNYAFDPAIFGFMGYSGFAIVAGEALVIEEITVDICSRTDQVEAAILAAITETNDCMEVTADQLARITELDLSDPTQEDVSTDELSTDDITMLRSGDFAGLTGLTALDLRFNRLTTLNADIFNGLENLQILILSNNQLTTPLPSGIFNPLSALEYLDLENNAFTTLPAGIFNGLRSSLKILLLGNELGDEKLEQLPDGIFSNLTELRALNLCYNELTALPSGINGLTKLRVLILCHNNLEELPDGIFSGLTQLTGIRVDGNSTDPLPLTLRLQESSEGMAVVEVAQGVPFGVVDSDGGVTATVSITGGTFVESSTWIWRNNEFCHRNRSDNHDRTNRKFRVRIHGRSGSHRARHHGL